jgi:hypothetical protein
VSAPVREVRQARSQTIGSFLWTFSLCFVLGARRNYLLPGIIFDLGRIGLLSVSWRFVRFVKGRASVLSLRHFLSPISHDTLPGSVFANNVLHPIAFPRARGTGLYPRQMKSLRVKALAAILSSVIELWAPSAITVSLPLCCVKLCKI